jgi:hydroxypyruvate isomerase
MRRRDFMGVCTGAALAAAVNSPTATASPDIIAAAEAEGVPFSLSVMLWTVFRDLPFPQRLEKIHEAGYRYVELVDEFKNWKKEDFTAARRKKQELGIEFDGTTGVWLSLADPAARDAFLKALREFVPTMKELECTRLIMQTGNKVAGLTQEQMHANCIETLKRGADIAAENNIELLIENIDPEENPKYFLTQSAEGFDIVRSVGNPHVKFLYDLFHEQISAGNLIAKLRKNIDVVALMHIADVPGRHAPGTGEINYSNIFRVLGELGYSRYIAMEFMPLGEPIQELRAAREMAVSSARAAHAARSLASGRQHESA